MTDTITAGTILIEEGVRLPGSGLLQTESYSDGWVAVKDTLREFEQSVRESGLTFFFMAGEIKARAFGFDRQKALRTALTRLMAQVKSQRCNGIEIMQVIDKSFLSVPYVTVFAHARHLQNGLLFSRNGNSS